MSRHSIHVSLGYHYVAPRSPTENGQAAPFTLGTTAISDLRAFCLPVLAWILQRNMTNGRYIQVSCYIFIYTYIEMVLMIITVIYNIYPIYTYNIIIQTIPYM